MTAMSCDKFNLLLSIASKETTELGGPVTRSDAFMPGSTEVVKSSMETCDSMLDHSNL